MAPRKRGTRLDEDWIPSPEVRAEILSEFPTIDLKAEHADFVDYWMSKAGRDGVKLDWDRTWRTWMRKQGRTTRTRQPHIQPVPAYTSKPPVSPEEYDRRVGLA